MKLIRALAVFGAVWLAGARPAIAQLQALPVYFSPSGGAGITFSADVGRTMVNTLGGYPTFRTPSSAAARVSLGISFVTLTATAGLIDLDRTPGESPVFQQGFLVAIRILRPPLFPVAVAMHGGSSAFQVRGSTNWVKTVEFPFGIGVGRQFGIGRMLIEPWIAGCVEVSSVGARDARPGRVPVVSNNQYGYGSSGGVNFTVLPGMAVHVAVDWSVLRPNRSSPIIAQTYQAERLTVGIGVHYGFNLPFLPGAPLVSR